MLIAFTMSIISRNRAIQQHLLEDTDSDDSCGGEETLRRVEQNDDTLTTLSIGNYTEGEWEGCVSPRMWQCIIF